MAKFKVTDPKGIHLGGKHLKAGDVFEGETKNAHISTGLHFKQIVAVGAAEKLGSDSKKSVASPEDK